MKRLCSAAEIWSKAKKRPVSAAASTRKKAGSAPAPVSFSLPFSVGKRRLPGRNLTKALCPDRVFFRQRFQGTGRRSRRQPRQVRKEATVTVVAGCPVPKRAQIICALLFYAPLRIFGGRNALPCSSPFFLHLSGQGVFPLRSVRSRRPYGFCAPAAYARRRKRHMTAPQKARTPFPTTIPAVPEQKNTVSGTMKPPPPPETCGSVPSAPLRPSSSPPGTADAQARILYDWFSGTHSPHARRRACRTRRQETRRGDWRRCGMPHAVCPQPESALCRTPFSRSAACAEKKRGRRRLSFRPRPRSSFAPPWRVSRHFLCESSGLCGRYGSRVAAHMRARSCSINTVLPPRAPVNAAAVLSAFCKKRTTAAS